LLRAATELSLDDAEVWSWGAMEVAQGLVEDGLLRGGPDPFGLPSVFVYDGYPGGASFADVAFARPAPVGRDDRGDRGLRTAQRMPVVCAIPANAATATTHLTRQVPF
jgi:hypothetical protein